MKKSLKLLLISLSLAIIATIIECPNCDHVCDENCTYDEESVCQHECDYSIEPLDKWEPWG